MRACAESAPTPSLADRERRFLSPDAQPPEPESSTSSAGFTISWTNCRRTKPSLRASCWKTCGTRPMWTGRRLTTKPSHLSTVAVPISPRGASSRSTNTGANADCELSDQRLARSRENSRPARPSHSSAASGRGSIYCATIPSIRDFRRCSPNARECESRASEAGASVHHGRRQPVFPDRSLTSAGRSLCRDLGSRWFSERFHRNALVIDFQHGQVRGTARRLENDAVALC